MPATERLRILIAEDAVTDLELIQRELAQTGLAHVLHHVDGADAFGRALTDFVPDLILTDHSMPQFTARDALRLARERRPDAPVIVVTGSLDEETAADYIKAGAADYVVKTHLKRLGPAVLRALALRQAQQEKARAEEALRRSEEQLARAQAIAHLGSWELELANLDHLDQNALVWSAEVFRIFGYAPGQFTPTNERFFRSVHPDDVPLVRDAVARTLRTGEPYLLEHRIVLPDGTQRTVREQGLLDRDESGRPRRLLATVLDVTEQRGIEHQLRQAQKMEAVGRLAGGLAHDFNNILTAITGYAGLLLEDLAAADARRGDVDEIRRAAERAAALTRQLLAFSRQQVLAPRVLDLNDLVTNLDNMLRRLIGEDVELVTVPAPDLGAIRADPGQLEQVLVNLVVNARDAMPEGGRLTIETANVTLDEDYTRLHAPALPGQYVLLAVSDTGTGMDPETRNHIFEPFYTTKEKGKGTGLGLATVYGIVKQSGGFVWVYSEPGQGATFKIYLPRVDERAQPLETPAASTTSLRGTETVLLVEDEVTVRTVARQMLERQGYTVLEATGAEAATAIAETHDGPIHLLLTDVVMPGSSGRALADRLTPLRPELRVLFMSGYTDEAVVRHGMLERGVAYLQKPFAPEGLARRVREVIDRA
ncbi:MAG: response regulator [Gemmatimonadales bacterium]